MMMMMMMMTAVDSLGWMDQVAWFGWACITKGDEAVQLGHSHVIFS